MNAVRTIQIRKRSLAVWLLGTFIGMVGCESEEAPAPLVGPVIAAPANAEKPSKTDSPEKVGPGIIGPRNVESAPKPEQVSRAQEYVAPFPERVEMFSPPQRKNVAVRRSNDRRHSAIELKGFVRPPGESPIAVLAIDGVIQPVGVGEEKFGIKVVSIDRPSVTLQRGSSRWTETLE